MTMMLNRRTCLSDKDLLLLADRELSPRRAGRARGHLDGCLSCSRRLIQFENAMADYLSFHEDSLQEAHLDRNAQDASRAALKASLASAPDKTRHRGNRASPAMLVRQFASAGLALLIVAGSAWVVRAISPRLVRGRSSDQLASALPLKRLTPGAVHAVRLDEVCGNESGEPARLVDPALEGQVFREYGIPESTQNAYELDYLITPELGGSTDIHNLWPEPYASTSWNAHVKDELEDHLHQLVCKGKLPLTTAQDEIASDWIAAYKRHFHTDRPLTDAAALSAAPTAAKPRVIFSQMNPNL